MRISCNGCRVLRKGCSENCTIRPCLQWIKSPESQANATLFLAKFYGRAGLLNLIDSGPDHLRPAIFRSLLYEACGRMVNPVDGSVGLMWSGNWAQCQAAVDAVLNGSPLPQNPPSGSRASHELIPLHMTCDIRHVSKDPTISNTTSEMERIHKVQTRGSLAGCSSKNQLGESSHEAPPSQLGIPNATQCENTETGTRIQTDAGEVGLELSLG